MKLKVLINALTAAGLFIGTVIGAGFASGRELAVFFGSELRFVWLVAFMLFVAFFFFARLFMRFGAKRKLHSLSAYIGCAFRRGKSAANFAFLGCALISSAAMAAGITATLKPLLGGFSVVFSVVAFAIAFWLCARGVGRLKVVNAIVVPAILFVILFVAFSQNDFGKVIADEYRGGNLLNALTAPILYASMNMLLAFGALVSLGEELSAKEIDLAAVIGSAVATAVVVVMLYALATKGEYKFIDVPLYALSKNVGSGMTGVALVVILLAIFTTLLSSLYPLVKASDELFSSKPLSFFVEFGACFLLAAVGFYNIVEYFYPLQAVFGLLLFAAVYAREGESALPVFNDKSFKQGNKEID